MTGHAVGAIDWDRVGMSETLVIFMGLTTFGEIARELIARGRDRDTPAMAVRWGTRPDQQTLTGTLATLPGIVEERGMKPPATIIVGEVVRLREKLNWYERLPLFGQRIVVTRSSGQAGALRTRLEALGAGVIEMPTIEIQPAADHGPLDQAIAQLASYDWLIFTSANGVRTFVERMDRSAADFRTLRARICAIGPATRAAIEALHLKVDLMGTEYVAEGLLKAFESHQLEGARILLPRAAVARDLVPAELAPPRRASGRGGSLPHGIAARRRRPCPRDLRRQPQARLDRIHQLIDGAEFRRRGAAGCAGGRPRGVHRTGHHAHRARSGDRGRGGSAHVHHRRVGGSDLGMKSRTEPRALASGPWQRNSFSRSRR